MDKRYQVFVSSTFKDLEDERKHVIQTLMEMDCIPAGMELFPAIDEEQWEFIKKIIDDCDYYLLIIGGRYGTIAEDGLSYTEKEFDYAVSRGLKVIVLLHENPEELPAKKSEFNPHAREKLASFIEKASAGRLRKTWSTVKELPGLVSLSMQKTIKTYPAIGWVRADKISNESALNDLNKLRKENDELKAEIESLKENGSHSVVPDLVELDSIFNFKFTAHYSIVDYANHGSREFGIDMSWGDMFYIISPYLHGECLESKISGILGAACMERVNQKASSASIVAQDLKTISIQFIAYGLIEVRAIKTLKGGITDHWILTDAGKNEMLRARTIKKNDIS